MLLILFTASTYVSGATVCFSLLPRGSVYCYSSTDSCSLKPGGTTLVAKDEAKAEQLIGGHLTGAETSQPGERIGVSGVCVRTQNHDNPSSRRISQDGKSAGVHVGKDQVLTTRGGLATGTS
ncbi:hypothetical protein WMY93_032732 [Mugilogobius chulae]|uniref:Secreted protein n=1 Tax=Mugilogobius chulae TaxID=88201 RepID=A0AAW0MVJ1_9GOBI